MRLPVPAPLRQRVRLKAVRSICPPQPRRALTDTVPLHDCPARSLTTPSHQASGTPIGRIHPIKRPSHTANRHDPAAQLPDMFDIPHSDPTPRTTAQRILLTLRRSGRIVFAVTVAAVGTAGLATLAYELLFDPAHSAHSHSFDFIQHHPKAVALLGGGGRLIDVSDPWRGKLCHDTVRQAGDVQWAECRYWVRGDGPHGGEGEVTAVLRRSGKRGGWLIVYVTLDGVRADGRRQRVVVCDYRDQVQREQSQAAVG